MQLRYISGPLDHKCLSQFEASYSTEYIYRVSIGEMAVDIRKEKLNSPLLGSYDLKDIEGSIADADQTIVAENEGELVGFIAVKFESWNNRAEIDGIYVLPEYKRRGIGMALIKEAVNYARTVRARCLWLETQNINHPAIRFYLKAGFKFCGFDNSLYDPGEVSPGETALYFSMDIE